MSFRPPKVVDPSKQLPLSSSSTKTTSKTMTEENQNIQVFVRSRPLNEREKKSQLELAADRRVIRYAPQNKVYSFDSVFDANAKQMEVYRSVVEPLVDQVTEGYNCTVFAYGQTGTGKTFTMVGKRTDLDVSWDEDPTSGMIPRAIDQLIDELAAQNTEYTIRVSFLELYNEDAYDLLSPLSDSNKLRIYNDPERPGSVIISGLVEMPVSTKAEIFTILEKGSIKRQTAPTLMNALSSRSHSIFSITVNIKEVLLNGEEVFKIGKLNLVDLAGSENIGRSGAVEERAREASNINKSLLTLGRVITLLVEKSPHIPYRDSKLTRLLQDSLGGKTKTSIIATISPAFDDLEDTLSTLEYAQRAKKITNKPEVNLRMSKKAAIAEYVLEIERLRRDLEATRDKKGVFVDAQNYAKMESTLKEQETNLELREAQIIDLSKEVEKWVGLHDETTANLDAKCAQLSSLQAATDRLLLDLELTRQSLEATKTEVEEQKVLVEEHQRTEHVLKEQATRILHVADKCTDDNAHLFRKIDTLNEHSQKNVQQLDTFKNNFIAHIDDIQQMGANIAGTIDDGYQAIGENITAKTAAIGEKNKQLTASFTAMTGTVDAHSGLILAALQTDKESLCQTVGSVNQLLEDFGASMSAKIAASLEGLAEKELLMKKLLESVQVDTVAAKRRLEELTMGEMNRLNETTKTYITSVLSIKESAERRYEQKCTELKETQEEMARVKASTSSLQALLGNVKETLTSVDETVGTINSSVEKMDSCLEEASKREATFTSAITFKADDLVSEFGASKAKTDAFFTALDKSAHEDCQLVLDRCRQVQELQGQQQETLKSSAEELVAALEESTVAITEKLTTGVVELVEDSLKQRSETLAHLKEGVEKLGEEGSSTASAISSLVSSADQTTLASYQTMRIHSGSFRSSQNHLLADCLDLVERTDYERYMATGMTPKKVGYEYPRDLVATSPYDRILSRYRESKRKEDAAVLQIEFNEEGAASSSSATSSSTESLHDLQANQNVPPPYGDEVGVAEKTFVVGTNNNVVKPVVVVKGEAKTDELKKKKKQDKVRPANKGANRKHLKELNPN